MRVCVCVEGVRVEGGRGEGKGGGKEREGGAHVCGTMPLAMPLAK